MTTLWFSLRRRLLALLLGGVSVAWLAMMVLSYIDAHGEVDALFDAQLAQSAQTLLALASHDEAVAIQDLGDAAHKYQRRLKYQIWRADGRLLQRSADAPESPLVNADAFTETDDGNGHWRHYSQWNAKYTLQVQVSENHQLRDILIGHIAWRLLLPALLGLPILGLWVWLATRRGLSSLDAIASQIASRAPQQLLPITPASAPLEIRPMLDALNGLLRRVDVALEGERRFTADAAHELRTPLAALQAQLQVALRARDEAERNRSLAQLQSGLARASHLVDQMLLLARLDPESALPDPQPVDLGQLAEDVCAELGHQILERQLDFDLSVTPDCVVVGQREWLRVLLRNLVDNAVRYTPPGSKVCVDVTGETGLCCISVTDSGPGIPAEQREGALRRFHRLQQNEASGSGLGLAIVARIADLHNTRLKLSNAPHLSGLCASVQFSASGFCAAAPAQKF